MFIGQSLGEITTTVYMRAAVSAIFGINSEFGITEKTKMKSMDYIRLWPQLSLIFLILISVIWGLNRYVYEREAAILVNSFWTLYQGAVLSSIFYFNRVNVEELACKTPFKDLKFEYRIIEGEGRGEFFEKGMWKSCFYIFIPEKLNPGTLILCKTYLPIKKEEVIFEANVLWSSHIKKPEGFKTGLGVVTISKHDEDKLSAIIRA